MSATASFVLGLGLLASTAVSLVYWARGGQSSLVCFTLRWLIGARCLGRRLSQRLGQWLPVEHGSRRCGKIVGWAALGVLPVVWGASVVTGTALLTKSMEVPAGEFAVPASVLGATSQGLNSLGLAVACWACLVVVLAVSLGRASAALRARLRRDLFTQRLSEQARSCVEVEEILAARLSGTPESVGHMIETWRCWISDLDLSRRSRLELVALPSSSQLFWLDALLIVLDVAALADTVRPDTDQGARQLLVAGCAYVQEVSGRLGLTVVTTVPSLHGREERSFSVTLARLAYAGVRLRQDCQTAEHRFYERRCGYAPFILALAERLQPRETPTAS